jgi:hypothetical protein
MSMIEPLPIAMATLASIVLGFVWYSPLLFAKPWSKLNGLQNKKTKMTVTPFLATILTSIVLAILLNALIIAFDVTTLQNAWKVGLLLWFGFDFMPSVTRTLFSKKRLELVLIDTGHQAANILLMSWILMKY